MIINGRQVVLKPEFDEMLDEMLEWFISQGNEQFAKQFVRGLYNDIVHKIAPPPSRKPLRICLEANAAKTLPALCFPQEIPRNV